MNEKNEELTIVEIQIILSIVVLIVVILSLLLGYNSYLKLKGEKAFWNEKEVRNILVINKITILIISLLTFIISLKNVELNKKKEKDLKNANLEAIAAFLIIIPAIILLIVAFNQKSDDFIDQEVI